MDLSFFHHTLATALQENISKNNTPAKEAPWCVYRCEAHKRAALNLLKAASLFRMYFLFEFFFYVAPPALLFRSARTSLRLSRIAATKRVCRLSFLLCCFSHCTVLSLYLYVALALCVFLTEGARQIPANLRDIENVVE